ncbi:MAG: hypothetical protein KAU23_02530 [Anaerolineales bacterium]|nr:hypothetical protein [Anaerolineales bacterium]
MKRQPYLTNHCLYVIGLALMVILASCSSLEQPTALPATVIPTLISIEPGIKSGITMLTNKLVCPSIPSTAVLIPPAPYDEDLGDCALIGRSGEIEAWLVELELIAENCRANREANWASALAARDNLDSQIDEFEPEPEGVETVTPQIEIELDAEVSCPIYDDPETSELPELIPPPTHRYTHWLKRIGENVGEYCTMIDELVKPLWQACDEINFYQDCQAPNPEQYHSIIEWKMNAAQINYNYTDFFYTNTLQTYGWGNFRVYFNEASIDCPIVQQLASIPTFTFSKNAFCRKGPSVDYEDLTAFLQHQSVQIDGRNQDDPLWWWVLIPDSSNHCWVSNSTGSASGLLEDVNTVEAPPLPLAPPVCTRDLSQKQCKAAGGTWKLDPGQDSPVYFCDCSK